MLLVLFLPSSSCLQKKSCALFFHRCKHLILISSVHFNWPLLCLFAQMLWNNNKRTFQNAKQEKNKQNIQMDIFSFHPPYLIESHLKQFHVTVWCWFILFVQLMYFVVALHFPLTCFFSVFAIWFDFIWISGIRLGSIYRLQNSILIYLCDSFIFPFDSKQNKTTTKNNEKV